METDLANEQVKRVIRKEVVETMQKLKLRKENRPSKVSGEMILALGKIGVKMIMDLCQRISDDRRRTEE